jgi:hypothetical protein
MSKKMLTALILIGLCALVLVYNTRATIIDRNITIDLLVTSVKMIKSLAFLMFLSIGVVIGVLLHK